MAKTKAKTKKASAPRRVEAAAEEESGISAIEVEGFKSIRESTQITIKPLTILAGANSSGKSSIMQPVLLMKQTLEATSDPGPLLLEGPNAKYTKVAQFLWAGQSARSRPSRMSVGLSCGEGEQVRLFLCTTERGGIDLEKLAYHRADVAYELRPEMVGAEIRNIFLQQRSFFKNIDQKSFSFFVDRSRISLVAVAQEAPSIAGGTRYMMDPFSVIRNGLLSMVHVPALRGDRERTYRAFAAGRDFPGTFEPYVASIIHHWQVTADIRLEQLGAALNRLGLNWKVEAARVDDTRFELRVGRLKTKTTEGARDLVSIADVGFGVSQVLPVLVALLTARTGQLVYIEEPEMHLHPRAQVALTQILADAANRGVRVVVETHSALLLLGVQALVAEGALPPELVALHWFSLAADGATEVRSADLDEAGAFGDWPEDFDEVTLTAQSRYLDAAEKRLAKAQR